MQSLIWYKPHGTNFNFVALSELLPCFALLHHTLKYCGQLSTMKKTLTLKNEFDQVIATLQEIEKDDKLSSVRIKAKDQISEDFDFLIFGVPLRRKQEDRYPVKECCDIAKTDGSYILIVKPLDAAASFNKPSPVGLLRNKSKGMKDAAPQLPLLGKVDQLKRFTETEIVLASGMLEKENMRFQNSMIVKIKNDVSLESWGLNELRGVIDSSWVMRKTELLKLVVERLCEGGETEGDIYQSQNKSMYLNLDLVQKAHFNVERKYEEISSELENDESNRADLEKQFDELFSELKICQANLQKAIETFLNKKSEATAHDHANFTDGITSNDLDEQDMTDLVDNTKAEFEVEDLN